MSRGVVIDVGGRQPRGQFAGPSALTASNPPAMDREKKATPSASCGTEAIDDVVIRPSRHDDAEARSDRRANAVEDCLTGPFLNANELVKRVESARTSMSG
jgi:hypothetical protein